MEWKLSWAFVVLVGRKIYSKIVGWGRVWGWRVSGEFEKKFRLFLPLG